MEVSENPVCLLKRSIYGLKQSGVQWYKRLRDVLLKMGLKSSTHDPCLFYLNTGENSLLLTIYVDDILIGSNNAEWIQKVKDILSKSFQMKDLGRVKKCFGIQFIQNEKDHSVQLTQRDYLDNLLEVFGMTDCKTANTPIETNCTLRRQIKSMKK